MNSIHLMKKIQILTLVEILLDIHFDKEPVVITTQPVISGINSLDYKPFHMNLHLFSLSITKLPYSFITNN